MKKHFYLIFCLLASGCALEFTTTRKFPVKIDISGYKSILLEKIEGDQDGQIKSSLIEKFSLSERQSIAHIKIIDKMLAKKLEKTLGEPIPEDLIKTETVLLGKVLQKSTKVLPVRETSISEKSLNPFEEDALKSMIGGTYTGRSYVREGKGILVVNFSLIEIKTGKSIFSGAVKANVSHKEIDYTPSPPNISLDLLYSSTCEKLGEEFVKLFTSYREEIKVELEEIDHPEFEYGLKFAKSGQWKMAAFIFSKIARQVSDREVKAQAWYNQAIAIHYSGQPKKAFPFYQKALEINSNPLYLEQLQKCQAELN